MKKYLSALWGYMAFTLTLVGITGLSWETFRPGGFIDRYAGAVWDLETRNPLLVTPIIIGLAFLIPRLFRGNLKIGKSHNAADIVVFVLIAAGAYFSFKWWIL